MGRFPRSFDKTPASKQAGKHAGVGIGCATLYSDSTFQSQQRPQSLYIAHRHNTEIQRDSNGINNQSQGYSCIFCSAVHST
jgi:hypothetical protein